MATTITFTGAVPDASHRGIMPWELPETTDPPSPGAAPPSPGAAPPSPVAAPPSPVAAPPSPVAAPPSPVAAPVAILDLKSGMERFRCPISLDLPKDPVTGADGLIYEWECLKGWFEAPANRSLVEVKSPGNGVMMPKFAVRSHDTYTQYKAWCEHHELPLPAPFNGSRTYEWVQQAEVTVVKPTRREGAGRATPYQRRLSYTFQVHCRDVPDAFHLDSSCRETRDAFITPAPLAADAPLEQKLGLLRVDKLAELYRTNVGAGPVTPTRTWITGALCWAVQAHARAGLSSLDGIGQYILTVYRRDEREVVSVTLSLTAQLARRYYSVDQEDDPLEVDDLIDRLAAIPLREVEALAAMNGHADAMAVHQFTRRDSRAHWLARRLVEQRRE